MHGHGDGNDKEKKERIADQVSKGLISKLREGGFSESIHGVSPKTGYMTAITNKTEKKILLTDVSEKDLHDFILNNFKTLGKEDMYFGGWLDTDKATGERWAYFDASKNIQSLEEAVKVAASSKQIAIYDLAGDRSLYIDYAENNKVWYWKDPNAETGKTWLE